MIAIHFNCNVFISVLFPTLTGILSNIIRVIIRRWGAWHVAHMGKMKNSSWITKGNTLHGRIIIKLDLKEIGCDNVKWIHLESWNISVRYMSLISSFQISVATVLKIAKCINQTYYCCHILQTVSETFYNTVNIWWNIHKHTFLHDLKSTILGLN